MIKFKKVHNFPDFPKMDEHGYFLNISRFEGVGGLPDLNNSCLG